MATNLNTFDQVVAWYESTPPIRGVRKKYNVRPIEDRSRWWERIYKHTDNMYPLLDGYYSVSQVSTHGSFESLSEEEKRICNAHMLNMAPITWERRADGDYVKIVLIRGIPQSRYKFFRNHLPRGLRHTFRGDGKHYIECAGTKHILPKSNPQDPKYLEFKFIKEGVFERTERKVLVRTDRVNKEQTKQLRPHINKLWEWMQVVMPIYGTTLDEQVLALNKRMYERGVPHNLRWASDKTRAWVKEVLLDENHPDRSDLALACVADLRLYTTEWNSYTVNGEARVNIIKYFEVTPKSKEKLRKMFYKMFDVAQYEYQ